MSTKRSFFERLTGTVRMDEAENTLSTPGSISAHDLKKREEGTLDTAGSSSWIDESTEKEAELTVDLYQTADALIVKSMIAGVRPEDLDVTITRDAVTIRGKREEERISSSDDYFVKELFWGTFSRTIQLPEEVDVDGAEAVEKHGLLILKLPKLDKKRQSKLKVKTV